MNNFPYREVAQTMRMQNKAPHNAMTPVEYHSAVAVYAVIYALETLAEEERHDSE